METTKLTNKRADIASRKLISLLNLIEWKVKFEFISQCRGLGYAYGTSVETVILAIAQASRYFSAL